MSLRRIKKLGRSRSRGGAHQPRQGRKIRGSPGATSESSYDSTDYPIGNRDRGPVSSQEAGGDKHEGNMSNWGPVSSQEADGGEQDGNMNKSDEDDSRRTDVFVVFPVLPPPAPWLQKREFFNCQAKQFKEMLKKNGRRR